MKNTAYFKKLQDPRWQRKRLIIFERDKWRCVICSEVVGQLHVHHAYYVSGRDPWEYPDGTLATLCKACHEGFKIDDTTTEIEYQGWEKLVGLGLTGSEYIEAHVGWFADALKDLSKEGIQPVHAIIELTDVVKGWTRSLKLKNHNNKPENV